MDKNESNILLFDGVCNLCNNTVYFIIRRDKRAKFRFASIQSDAGQSLIRRIGLPPGNPGFLVYLLDNRLFIKSSAVLQILRELGGGWQLFYGNRKYLQAGL